MTRLENGPQSILFTFGDMGVLQGELKIKQSQ